MALQTAPAPIPLKVISNTAAGREGVIIVEGPTYDSVDGTHLKTEVLKLASERMSSPGINEVSGPYAVDADGNCGDDVQQARVPVAGYRNDFKIMAAR